MTPKNRVGATEIADLTAQFDHGIHKLPDRLNFGLHVHGDDDVKFVFNRGHEIHDRQTIPFQIMLECRCV
jgi:hypothetical protein